MDVKDLMIGDWVHYWILERDAKINDIMSTGRLGIIFTDSKDEVGYIHGIMSESIKPIPLTAEILEKNGFVPFVRFKDMVLYKSADNRIEANNHEEMVNSFNKWSIHVDTENMMTMGYFEITYVHELQHALQLCGFEKKIEL